jgi:hypothetical protein
MAGVVAPLKSNHHVGMFGQQVNYFTLAFVPPLGSDNYDICHNVISLLFSFNKIDPPASGS